MFNEHWNHNANRIVIEDATAEDFRTLLDYFYKGTIELGDHNIDAIFYMAHKYDVDDLLTSCVEFAIKRLSAENVIDFYDMAVRFSQEHLQVKCSAFITTNTASVLSSAAFISCDRATLVEILKIPKMSCKEHIVLDACIDWAKFQCQLKKIDGLCSGSLRAELNECFDLIRFKEMERDEFRKRYELLKVIFTKQEMNEMCVYFMEIDSWTTSIRFKSVEVKVPTIIVTFGRTDLRSEAKISCLSFRITMSAMLSGITFGIGDKYSCISWARIRKRIRAKDECVFSKSRSIMWRDLPSQYPASISYEDE